MARRRVLVAGGSGFLGSRVVRRLVDGDFEVHATSRSVRDSEEDGVHWWRCDLADLASTRELLDSVGPQVVFNMAGYATGAPHLELVPRTLNSNLIATVNLLVAAAERGCDRFFMAKSMTEPDAADVDTVAASPYSMSKWAGSGYASLFRSLYGLPIVNLRIFMTYGPQRDLTKLIPYVTTSLLRGEAPKLASGRLEMDWIYVDDVADACLAAIDVQGLEGRTVDVGTGSLTTVRGVVERLVSLTGATAEPRFGELPDRPREVVRVADADDARATIGWTADVDLDEGLRRTVDWYRESL